MKNYGTACERFAKLACIAHIALNEFNVGQLPQRMVDWRGQRKHADLGAALVQGAHQMQSEKSRSARDCHRTAGPETSAMNHCFDSVSDNTRKIGEMGGKN